MEIKVGDRRIETDVDTQLASVLLGLGWPSTFRVSLPFSVLQSGNPSHTIPTGLFLRKDNPV